jgi:D-3-phosphoglycerate dehydrogenase / 2-oxoglutarate reductase
VTVRVVVIDSGYESYETEASILEPVGARVEVVPCDGDAGKVKHAVLDADAVMVRESRVSRAAIEAMRRCRAIVRYGIGVDNIDLEAARERRIYVANVPDYGCEEVSDQAMALLLAVARRIAARDRAVRSGAWNVSRSQRMYRVAGRVLGLVGYGRIARALERKMRGIGVARVLVHDPLLGESPPGVAMVDLDTLCREADYISLHAPATAHTRRMIDARRIALMKPTAILINTARGTLVDEDALLVALREQRLQGAGLDVYESEPPRRDHPLFALDNAVLSDHTGWYSEESIPELQEKAAQEVARVLRGEAPRNWLNPW